MTELYDVYFTRKSGEECRINGLGLPLPKAERLAAKTCIRLGKEWQPTGIYEWTDTGTGNTVHLEEHSV